MINVEVKVKQESWTRLHSVQLVTVKDLILGHSFLVNIDRILFSIGTITHARTRVIRT